MDQKIRKGRLWIITGTNGHMIHTAIRWTVGARCNNICRPRRGSPDGVVFLRTQPSPRSFGACSRKHRCAAVSTVIFPLTHRCLGIKWSKLLRFAELARAGTGQEFLPQHRSPGGVSLAGALLVDILAARWANEAPLFCSSASCTRMPARGVQQTRARCWTVLFKISFKITQHSGLICTSKWMTMRGVRDSS